MYQKIIKKNFLCHEKQERNPSEIKEGIQFPSGVIIVGYDAWRLLNYMDYPSYDLETYSSESFYRKYDITEDNIRIKEFVKPERKKKEYHRRKTIDWSAYM